jgi:hypothetical protein
MKRIAHLNLSLCLFFLLFCSKANAASVFLYFIDGLLPSAKGWTFEGENVSTGTILNETDVASVSGGKLLVNTIPQGNPVTTQVFSRWTMPVAID